MILSWEQIAGILPIPHRLEPPAGSLRAQHGKALRESLQDRVCGATRDSDDDLVAQLVCTLQSHGPEINHCAEYYTPRGTHFIFWLVDVEPEGARIPDADLWPSTALNTFVNGTPIHQCTPLCRPEPPYDGPVRQGKPDPYDRTPVRCGCGGSMTPGQVHYCRGIA